MLLAKYKKTIIGLTAVAVMSLGGITAFATASEATPTAVNYEGVTNIEARKGEYKIAKKIDPKTIGELMEKTESGLTLTAVSTNIDTANVQKGEYKIGNKIDPKTVDGQIKATVAR